MARSAIAVLATFCVSLGSRGRRGERRWKDALGKRNALRFWVFGGGAKEKGEGLKTEGEEGGAE